MNKLDLELTPIEEIIDELISRTESCVICWVPLKPDRDGSDIKSIWKAKLATDAIGLCEVVKATILDSIRMEDIDE